MVDSDADDNGNLKDFIDDAADDDDGDEDVVNGNNHENGKDVVEEYDGEDYDQVANGDEGDDGVDATQVPEAYNSEEIEGAVYYDGEMDVDADDEGEAEDEEGERHGG